MSRAVPGSTAAASPSTRSPRSRCAPKYSVLPSGATAKDSVSTLARSVTGMTRRLPRRDIDDDELVRERDVDDALAVGKERRGPLTWIVGELDRFLGRRRRRRPRRSLPTEVLLMIAARQEPAVRRPAVQPGACRLRTSTFFEWLHLRLLRRKRRPREERRRRVVVHRPACRLRRKRAVIEVAAGRRQHAREPTAVGTNRVTE